MGDETRDVTAIKLLMRNERQYRRLYVLGFVTEPAHSGMQPALPIPVETLAPPKNSKNFSYKFKALSCMCWLYTLSLKITTYS